MKNFKAVIVLVFVLLTSSTFAFTGLSNVWTKTLENKSSLGMGIASDSNGNIYVSGRISKNNENYGVLIKYDVNGSILWTQKVNYGNCYVDNKENIYVAGTIVDESTNSHPNPVDFHLTKLDDDGKKIWSKTWGTEEDDRCSGISIDNLGNVYVVGYTRGSFDGNLNNGACDISLSKIDEDGNILWTKMWGSYKDDFGIGVTIDKLGNIYVVGYTEGSYHGQINNNRDTDFCLTKCDNDGNLLWTKIWGKNWDVGNCVAVDNSNNVYVAGTTHKINKRNNSDDVDLYLIKMNENGDRQWEKTWGSKKDDYAQGICIDSSNNIYVAGGTADSFDGQKNCGGRRDLCITKFDVNGNEQVTRIWGTTLGDYGTGVCVDKDGNIFVTGFINDGFLCLTKFGVYNMEGIAISADNWKRNKKNSKLTLKNVSPLLKEYLSDGYGIGIVDGEGEIFAEPRELLTENNNIWKHKSLDKKINILYVEKEKKKKKKKKSSTTRLKFNLIKNSLPDAITVFAAPLE